MRNAGGFIKLSKGNGATEQCRPWPETGKAYRSRHSSSQFMNAHTSESLEGLLRHAPPKGLKSEGEQRIADFLDHHCIQYIYEAPTAVTQHDKVRIWYPDFYLPEYGLYIEYYGMIGNPDYDRGVIEKTAAYEASGLEVIPVYPSHLNKAWPEYLAREIREITRYRAHLADAKLPSYASIPGNGT